MQIVKETFYHLQRVNDVNIKWAVGDILSFNSNKENFYRKGLSQAISEIQIEYKFPNMLITNIEEDLLNGRCNQTTQDNLIELLDFIRTSAHKNKMIQHFQEAIYEYVRKKHFGALPSRGNCIWIVPQRDDLKEWEEILLSHKIRIFELKLTGNIHRTSGMLIDTEKNSQLSAAYRNALDYWKSDFTSSKEIEHLFEGTVTIIKQILD